MVLGENGGIPGGGTENAGNASVSAIRCFVNYGVQSQYKGRDNHGNKVRTAIVVY